MAVATNVAAGALPVSWQPYQWVAWPVVGVLLLALIIMELRQHHARRADDAACRRAAGSADDNGGNRPQAPVPEGAVTERVINVRAGRDAYTADHMIITQHRGEAERKGRAAEPGSGL